MVQVHYSFATLILGGRCRVWCILLIVHDKVGTLGPSSSSESKMETILAQEVRVLGDRELGQGLPN